MSEDISILAASRRRHYGTVEPSGACRLKPYKLYHISPGDTLVSIAVKYSTTVQHLKLLNHLWSTDISSLECIKVPSESVTSGSTTSSSECNNQSIELATVTSKREPRMGLNEKEALRQQHEKNDPNDDQDTTANAYLQSLFDRAQRAKQSASSVLEKSKLSEILSETSPAWSLPSPVHLHSSHDVAQPTVMVTSPSTASLNSVWIGPSLNRPQSYTTPPNWHDHYQL